MKIDSGSVNMESSRSYRENTVSFGRFTVERRQVEVGGSGIHAAVGGNTGNAGKEEAWDETAQGSSQENPADGSQENQPLKAELQDWQSRLQPVRSNVAVRSTQSRTAASIRHSTIRYIFELLFCYRRNRTNLWAGDGSTGNASAQTENTGRNPQQETGELQAGTGKINIRVLNYSHEVVQVEREDTTFSTVGTVRTSDGREIQFNVNVGMSREFQQHYQSRVGEAFVFCDPLVINLDTDVTELSDQTFYFDIDGDGELDEISGMGPGSGYLALDKNGDGVINDGKELFGTSSGNGFADLAAYDEDGNGWIDENDAVWDKLKIWCKDENGEDVLYRLSDKGVGAICLQNVATDFTLKGQGGRTQGAIRSSGIFLYENGAAGTIQHLDMAKYSAQA